MSDGKEGGENDQTSQAPSIATKFYTISHVDKELLKIKYEPYALVNELFRFYSLRYFISRGYEVPDKFLLMPESPFYGSLTWFYLAGKIIKENGFDKGKPARKLTQERAAEIINDLKKRELNADELHLAQAVLSKLDDPEFKTEMYRAVLPYLCCASDYIARVLPGRLHNLMMRLTLEASEYTSRRKAKELGLKVPSPPKAEAFLRGEVIKLNEEFMHFIERGGDRSRYSWTPKNCIGFSNKVDDLRPLWEFIIDEHEENEDGIQLYRKLMKSSRFQELSVNCNELTSGLIKKIPEYKKQREECLSSGNKKEARKLGDALTPLALACVHAARELHIPDHKPSTLLKKYEKGKKELAQ